MYVFCDMYEYITNMYIDLMINKLYDMICAKNLILSYSLFLKSKVNCKKYILMQI